MGIWEIVLIATALAADAFSASVCKGLSICRVKLKHTLIVGAWFGAFQALMPLLGYLLGSSFERYVVKVDHWVAFLLLALLGANMIKESFAKECDCSLDASLGIKTMAVMAVATSIDALAVGITFALDRSVNIWFAISAIGVITFLLSAVGVKIGSVFGSKNKKYAELAGGIVLILMGLKILLEHLGVISF